MKVAHCRGTADVVVAWSCKPHDLIIVRENFDSVITLQRDSCLVEISRYEVIKVQYTRADLTF
jgi:hypothetical protein